MKKTINNTLYVLIFTCFFYMLIFENPFNISLILYNTFNFNKTEIIITKIITCIFIFLLIFFIKRSFNKNYEYYDDKIIKFFKKANLSNSIKLIIGLILIISIVITLFYIGYKYFNKYITSTIGTVIITALCTCVGTIIANLIYDYIKLKEEEKIFLYKKLYIPIVEEYIHTHKGAAIPFTGLEETSREKFLNILIDGYVYMKNDKKLKNIIFEFYTTYYSKYENEDKSYYISDDEMNKKYYNVIDAIFDKYDSISTKDMVKILK